jgi:energy-converting hydrogenase Eha subunit E
MTWQTKTDALTPPAGGISLSRLSGLPEWLRSNLFVQADRKRLTWRRVLAGVLFVVAGAAVSLTRTSGPGALNSIWIEDAGNFLQDALHNSVLTTLTTQMNGYYDVVPRAVTAVAVAFPVAWAPGIMSAAAAAQYALFGLIVYIASGPFLRNPWLRLLVAVPAVVVPLGYTQVNNDLATVQFVALYGLFWLLLWRPVTRAGQVCAPIIMLGATLTSILPVFFAPLVAARLIADRSKTAIAVAVCWAAGLVAQWTVQVRGLSNRKGGLFTSPLWILGNYVTRAVPRAIFGEKALGGPGTNYRGSPVPLSIPDPAVHAALIWGACAIVVAVVVIALARLTAPHWPLAITALLFSVVLFVGEIIDNYPIVQPRYVIAPALLLYTAIVVMLRPRGATASVPAGQPSDSPSGDTAVTAAPAGVSLRSVAAWTPVTVFALLLAIVVGFNFRVVNTRSESPPWTAVVAAARHTCMTPGTADYEYSHLWWTVQIPCSRV